MENIWQFSKVYKNVPYSKQYYSRWDRTVIWEHPAETHIIYTGLGVPVLTIEYQDWREKGMNNPYPVRYPVGISHRNKCLYAIRALMEEHLDYIQARKDIYLPVYMELVKGQKQYDLLLSKLRNGHNLLIVEVDGPHQESLPYYKTEYGVSDDFIIGNTMLCTKTNLELMLNDPKHNFGHGYCLAWSLMLDI